MKQRNVELMSAADVTAAASVAMYPSDIERALDIIDAWVDLDRKLSFYDLIGAIYIAGKMDAVRMLRERKKHG